MSPFLPLLDKAPHARRADLKQLGYPVRMLASNDRIDNSFAQIF